MSKTKFEPRFYEAQTIAYEVTEGGDGFEVCFRREDREVEILVVQNGKSSTFTAKTHPDDQYDEQFGFELASARVWRGVFLTYIEEFCEFRQYVWGVKGWGELKNEDSEPQPIYELLAASKGPEFRQREAFSPSLKILVEYSKTGRVSKAVGSPQSWLQRARTNTGWEAVEIRVPTHGDWYLSDSANVLPADDIFTPTQPRVIVRRRVVVEEPVQFSAPNITGVCKPVYSRPVETPTCPEKYRTVIPTSAAPSTPNFHLVEEYKKGKRGGWDLLSAAEIAEKLDKAGYVPVAVRDACLGEYYWSWGCGDVIRSSSKASCAPLIVVPKADFKPSETPVVVPPAPHTFSKEERAWVARRLIVEKIPPSVPSDDEKALNFIRQELREERRDISLAEGFLKQYREWGFEPVDYRKAVPGEFVDTVFEGDPAIPHEVKYHSGAKLLIFRKRS